MSAILRALVGAATVLVVSKAAPLAAQATTTQRLAYVDTRVILESAPGKAEAEAMLQKEAVAWDAEVRKMQDQMTAMITKFQKESPAMTQAVRDKETKTIQDKQAEFQKRNDEINQEAEKRRNEVLQPLLDQVKLALEDVRKQMNLDMIFDVGQNATIVAVDKNLNLSDRVIARLRVLGAPVIAGPAKSGTAPAAKPSGMPINAPSGVGRPPVTPVKPDSTVPKKP